MAFHFSLQTALDVRERVEKIKMKELAEKLAFQQQIILKIEQISHQTSKAEQNLNSIKQSGGFTIDQLKHLSGFKNRMKLELADQNQQLELADKAVDEKQTALIEASRGRKTLEILKEKEYQRLMEKIAQLEQKNMDEIAGISFIRNRRETAAEL